jgi:cellulose synthase/poly-beta-1,6-N-acetylglucosamine synthase-like glycosyltransferase
MIEKMSNNSFTVPKDKFIVTVGIPAYNERGRIGCLLQQVLCQSDFHPDKIVVNASGSTDGTQDEIASVAKHDSLIEMIDNCERTGKAEALNEILEMCDTDLVIFIDSDVKLNDGCLREILKPFFSNNSIGVVSGNVMPLSNNSRGLFRYISWLERKLHHELCMNLINRGKPPKVNGTFFAVRRKVIERLPQNTVSDDEYVSWCAQRKGYIVTYAPNAIVYTKDPENCGDYVAKRRRIFAGHFLIKKSLGYVVPTTRMDEIAPMLLRLSVTEKRRIPFLLVMLSLQVLSYILALSDVSAGNIPYCYRVESAKFSSN